MKHYSKEEIIRTIMEKEKKHPDAEYFAYLFAMTTMLASFLLFSGIIYFAVSRFVICDESWKKHMVDAVSTIPLFFVYYKFRMRLCDAVDYMIFLLLRRLP